MDVNLLKKFLLGIGMKSLKESLFSDNITTDVPVNFDFVVDYVRDKIKKANKKGIDVDMPDKLLKTIDGFFEGFEKIHKDKQPIITNSRQTTINNIGLALFYNKMKRCFKYPDLQKID